MAVRLRELELLTFSNMEWNCAFIRRVSTHRCIRKKGTMYVHLKRKIEMKYVCVGLLVALLFEIRGTMDNWTDERTVLSSVQLPVVS